MKKEQLKEEFFKHLTETPSAGAEKISRLAADEIRATSMTPPDMLWAKIQKRIAAEAESRQTSFTDKLKALFSPPLVPALALGTIGILVTSFILLSQGTAPPQAPLVELSQNTPKQKGDVLVAKGVRIENLGGGSITRIPGATDKIILQSGAWQMALSHKELEKPVQFIFPGGMLEPVGTAFTVAIAQDGTVVNLSEGKIRLYERDAAGKKWKASDLSAPFKGTLKAAPVETDIKIENEVVEKKKELPSKYANYVGKDITIELKNGDRLSGKLRAAKGGALSLAGSSGNLRIRESDVVRVNRN